MIVSDSGVCSVWSDCLFVFFQSVFCVCWWLFLGGVSFAVSSLSFRGRGEKHFWESLFCPAKHKVIESPAGFQVSSFGIERATLLTCLHIYWRNHLF